MMPTITLEGAPRAHRKLNDLDDISDILRKPMNRALFRLAEKMSAYPPPPPGSTYRRTGSYGRRWTTASREIRRATTTRIEGRIGNNTTYGPVVGSAQFQAKIHRNRWSTDESVAEQEEKWIGDQFESAMDDKVNE